MLKASTTKFFVLVLAFLMLTCATFIAQADEGADTSMADNAVATTPVDPEVPAQGEATKPVETGAVQEGKTDDANTNASDVPSDKDVTDGNANSAVTDTKEPEKKDEQSSGNTASQDGDVDLDDEDEDETEEETVEYQILYKYETNEGEQELLVVVAEDELIKQPELEPTLDGHTFRFWYDSKVDFKDDEITAFEFDVAPKKDLVLQAYYEADVVLEDADGTTGEAIVDPEDEVDVPDESDVPDEKDEGELVDLSNSAIVTIIPDPEVPEVGAVILDDDDDLGDVIVTLEDEAVPLAGPEEGPDLTGCEILLSSNHGDYVMEGDMITVSATLIGYEPYEVELQWQYSVDGNEWIDVDGGNELSHSFEATSESVNYGWRLAVTVVGEALQSVEN